MLVFGLVVVFGFVLIVAGLTTWVERRVWARLQGRVGPNRVGPQGLLQWLADGVKCIMKEDVVRPPPMPGYSSWRPTSWS